MSNKYREAGVDLEAGYESVRRIQQHVAKTKIKGAMDSIGAFGGVFDLSMLKLKEPMLVSGTDGVGTKLMLAIACDRHDTIGIDAVAMCVNDVLVQGAMPLYFLDYLAVGKNNPQKIEQLVQGVAEGCIQSECALIGGETAEMPDMYAVDHYDIAGFCVGAVEKKKFIDGSKVKEGQVLIGLKSSGCHSNGYSLIRKVLLKDAKLSLDKVYEGFDETLGSVLLTPTKIYVKVMKHILSKVDIKGMAHITGGGFYENLPRMLSSGLGAEIQINSFPRPPIFDLIQKAGDISQDEMYNVFNMGIGFVFAVNAEDVGQVQTLVDEIKEEAFVIGTITKTGKVVLV